MSGEVIIGVLAAASGVITALFAGVVSVRRARVDEYAADVRILAAYRRAWLWAIRTIMKLRAIIAQSNDVVEPDGIDEELQSHMDSLAGKPRRVRKKAKNDD